MRTKQIKPNLHAKQQVISPAARNDMQICYDYYINLGYPEAIARQYMWDVFYAAWSR